VAEKWRLGTHLIAVSYNDVDFMASADHPNTRLLLRDRKGEIMEL